MRHRRKLRGRQLKRHRRVMIISIFIIFLTLSVGYAAFQTVISINIRSNIKIDDECVEGKVWEFSQKDEGQEFRVPCSGEYKVELWGASGGDSLEDISSGLQGTSIGGEGGYTSGIISIKKRQNLYLYVGSQGENRTYNSGIGVSQGGYNGGGNGYVSRTSCYQQSSGGGGSTDI